MKIKKYRFQSFENIYIDEMIGTLIKGQIVLILVPSYKISYEDFNVNYLKTDETVKMNSYRNLNDKVNYFISHSLINIFFSKLMNTTIEKLRYEVAEDKKPYIKNEYDIHYNISHTKGYCIIALSQNAIGIDIEYMDKDFEYEDIVKYSFSLKDGKCIKNFEDFYTYWVVKESYLKYKGTGLIQGLDTVEILRDCGDKFYIGDTLNGNYKFINIYRVRETGAKSDYVMAICK